MPLMEKEQREFIKSLLEMNAERDKIDEIVPRLESVRDEDMKLKEKWKKCRLMFDFWKKKETKWSSLARDAGSISFESPEDYSLVSLPNSEAYNTAIDKREFFEDNKNSLEEKMHHLQARIESLEEEIKFHQANFNLLKNKAEKFGFFPRLM